MNAFIQSWESLLRPAGIVAGAALLGLIAHAVFFSAFKQLSRRTPRVLVFRGALLKRIRGPLRLLFPLLAVYLALPLVLPDLSPALGDFLENALYVLTMAAAAWLLIAFVMATEDAVEQHYDVKAADNLQARRVITQTQILRRILVVLIGIVALALVLLRFVPIIGTGLLASAGVTGIIVGLAAQRTLGNLFAGFQIALTQPIRVEDVVIVEGEFGWVEEITLTYVVVRLWDQRRIVLPISYFIEQPFQNWTRTSSELLGTVFLYVDYAVPVEALRTEHRRIVETSERWDGRVCGLQVTDASERTVQLRCLQSASSAPRLFDLRCEVREQLIAFVQREYPEALPRTRAEVEGAAAALVDDSDSAGGDGA